METIEEVLDVSVATFLLFTKHEPARTALSTLAPGDEGRTAGLKNDYSSLRPDDQRRCEAALGEMAVDEVTASRVFEALASAFDEAGRNRNTSSGISALIVDYVAAVARVWRSSGLRPSRARHPERPDYRSQFHRFVDLVLSAFVAPAALRHDDGLDEIQQKTRQEHAKLSDEIRPLVSPALRRQDFEWLVSDDHLKKALRRIQKTAPQTP